MSVSLAETGELLHESGSQTVENRAEIFDFAGHPGSIRGQIRNGNEPNWLAAPMTAFPAGSESGTNSESDPPRPKTGCTMPYGPIH